MEIDEQNNYEDIDESHYESKSLMEENSLDITDDEEEEEASEIDEIGKETKKLVVNMQHRKRKMSFHDDYQFNIYFMALSPLYLSLEKLLSFLYLASLMTEEEILMMDILRWCREDFLPYQSAAYLLPKMMLEEIDDESVFNKHVPHAAELRFHSGAMALYLSLQYLPLRPLDFVINKIIESLKLPDDVREIGLLTMKSVMFRRAGSFSAPSVEVAAAASIILVLKVTFGMDNYHEEKLSDFADTFNKIFKSKGSSYRVFSWRKWHKHIKVTRNFIDQVGLGVKIDSSDDPTRVPADVIRLKRYFWGKGFWKTPIGKNNALDKDRWDSQLLRASLGLNLDTFRKVTDVEYNYKPYHLPYWGIVKQYMCEAFRDDEGRDCNKFLKAAKKLDEISFSSQRFNWLLHRYEIVSEFLSFKKDIDIIKLPMSDLQKATTVVSKAIKKEKELYKDIFYVPDPLKSFWEAKTLPLKDCPSNFQWLVLIMSEICETSENDVYKEYLKQESRYLTAINSSERDHVKIAFAEGEYVSEI